MPWYEGGGAGWWIIIPIIFMTFMMWRMMGRGGSMGMMCGMGGKHRHGQDDDVHTSRIASGNRIDSQETPLEIAMRRYAGGELSREEFRSIRDDLR